jgi:hypothetical protein
MQLLDQQHDPFTTTSAWFASKYAEVSPDLYLAVRKVIMPGAKRKPKSMKVMGFLVWERQCFSGNDFKLTIRGGIDF